MTITPHRPTTPSATSAVQRWAGLRDAHRARRQAWAAHRALERDLASYTSPSDVDDLLSAVRDQNPVQAEEIRSILTRNLREHHRAAQLAS